MTGIDAPVKVIAERLHDRGLLLEEIHHGSDESVLELEITPNRPDAMGMIGVAREVAAAFGVEMTIAPIGSEIDGETSSRSVSELASVTVDDDRACPRYCAAVVESVTVGPSPAWLVARLRAGGVKPINNVVDATNYVLLETGQPIHAFDLDRLDGSAIVVRTAEVGETIETLDGSKCELEHGDILICDAQRPVALAGVMGGANSEVSDATSRILIETANFAAEQVMLTSKRLGIRTDASARFERGVDPGICEWATRRVAQLIAELSGGMVAEGILDVKTREFCSIAVPLRTDRLNRLLGTSLTDDDIDEFLAPIGIERGADRSFRIPTWRVDLEREIDLVEEVARIYGYNNIERTLPGGSERIGGLSDLQNAERRLKSLLLGAGLDEAHTTSFTSDDAYDELGWGDVERVTVTNPLREADRYLRTSLVPTLLRAAKFNANRTARSIRLAEIGVVFEPVEGARPVERDVLAIVIAGVDNASPAHSGGRLRSYDIYDLKGAIDVVFDGLGLSYSADSDAADDVPPGFHPTRAAAIRFDGATIGWFAQLHPSVAKTLDLPRATHVAELACAPILEAHVCRRTSYVQIPQFPQTYFSAAFILDRNIDAQRVVDVLSEAGDETLADVELFDVFSGEGIPYGRRSLAFEFRFVADDRTLTDEDIRPVADRMIAAVENAFDAKLRG